MTPLAPPDHEQPIRPTQHLLTTNSLFVHCNLNDTPRPPPDHEQPIRPTHNLFDHEQPICPHAI